MLFPCLTVESTLNQGTEDSWPSIATSDMPQEKKDEKGTKALPKTETKSLHLSNIVRLVSLHLFFVLQAQSRLNFTNLSFGWWWLIEDILTGSLSHEIFCVSRLQPEWSLQTATARWQPDDSQKKPFQKFLRVHRLYAMWCTSYTGVDRLNNGSCNLAKT